jgi:hypothetical protein
MWKLKGRVFHGSDQNKFHVEVDGMKVHIYNLDLPQTPHEVLPNVIPQGGPFIGPLTKTEALGPLRLFLNPINSEYTYSLRHSKLTGSCLETLNLARITDPVHLKLNLNSVITTNISNTIEREKQKHGPIAMPEHPPTPKIYYVPPLCNGSYVAWKLFLSSGGYFSVTKKGTEMKRVIPISSAKQDEAIQFVEQILLPDCTSTQKRGWKNRQLRFHNSMRLLRKSFLQAPRDDWETCLPSKDKNWYEFAVLLLMLCTSVIPDARLVLVMQAIYQEFEMTPEFVLQKHKTDPMFWETKLHDLGRQKSNANNWVLAAKTTISLGRVPRNYTEIMLHYQGVGPKIALVTIQCSYGDVVSTLARKLNVKTVARDLIPCSNCMTANDTARCPD